jgi:flagellar biosynthetic protein FliP
LLAAAAPLAAAPGELPGGIRLGGGGPGPALELPLQIVLLLTALVFLPALLMAATPFLRLVVVLHFLRQALGTQTTPSNPVLTGLALALTLFLLQPVLAEVHETSWQPWAEGRIGAAEALERAAPPFKRYLVRFVREKDAALLVELSRSPRPARPEDLGLSVVVPAYMLSELRTGFQIGALLFLPFLVIDLVTASVTLAIGMVQLPPVMVSAPFKILLFVLVDGWNLVVGSLLRSLQP